jgi:glycosyltransferase involved in cell wall biosynthesis
VRFTVCAVNESELDIHAYPPEVTLQIDQEKAETYRHAAVSINLHAQETVVIVQHEYGIYGGNQGSSLVTFLEMLQCPIITTLHTVLADPSEEMRSVTEQIIAASDGLVTLTDSSHDLICSLYPEARSKAMRIMHGIHPLLYKPPEDVKPQFKLTNRKVLLTFGLLSRNKGIEYVISALPKIVEQIPESIYLVVGATHPAVLRQEGEAYRLELMKLVKDLSLEKHVRFMDDFLPVQDILEYLQATDIYIATSLDPNQAVSGTLSYALGAGRAVIATNFAQAKEAVTSQVGRVVPIRDSPAVAKAIIELFANPELLQSMNHAAFGRARSMLWSNVADDYIAGITSIIQVQGTKLNRWPAFNWGHLEALTDDFGMLQFSRGSRPHLASGYTLDDNSRALQVITFAFTAGILDEEKYNELAQKYVQVIINCLMQSPAVNYLSEATKHATKQNSTEDLSDSMARAYYSLQTVAYNGSATLRRIAVDVLSKLPATLHDFSHIRSTTQMLLGETIALRRGDSSRRPSVDALSKSLIASFHKNATPEWRWFDTTMTYANGQLCASLIEAASVGGLEECRAIGLESLEFLCKVCFMGDVYSAVGQSGWHGQDGSRALFDQQPEDTFSMMQALESAYNLTKDKKYIKRAEKAFSWFMGNNLIGVRVYDDKSGGCHDGLTPSGVNQNEGAESTLSYLGARLIMERLSGELLSAKN